MRESVDHTNAGGEDHPEGGIHLESVDGGEPYQGWVGADQLTVAAPIPLIVELHAEDASILWLQRDRAVDAPHYNWKFLGRLDERLEANLDGLRVAGDAGWAEALRAFEAHSEPGEMFVLSSLAFTRGPADIDRVIAALEDDQNGVLMRPATSALGWLPPTALQGRVAPLLADRRPAARELGLSACSVHRVDPRGRLNEFLRDVPSVRARALRLAGEVGRRDLVPTLSAVGQDDPPWCRFWASWSLVLLGDRGRALEQLRHSIAVSSPAKRMALLPAVLAGSAQAAAAWLDTLVEVPEGRLLQVRGAGLLGDPERIPWLIEQMSDPTLARAAGESVAMITGVDLAFSDLDGPPPSTLEEVPNDDPGDARVERDLDDELPWPDPDLVARWWLTQKETLTRHGCLFLGVPRGAPAFLKGFADGFQRQRRAAAFLQAVSRPDAVLPCWRSRATTPWRG